MQLCVEPHLVQLTYFKALLHLIQISKAPTEMLNEFLQKQARKARRCDCITPETITDSLTDPPTDRGNCYEMLSHLKNIVHQPVRSGQGVADESELDWTDWVGWWRIICGSLAFSSCFVTQVAVNRRTTL